MTPGPESDQRLVSEIKAEIAANGPITFARFMDLALYHPEYGYYNSSPAIIGREGDYYTSLNLHPAFGWLIARQAEEMWRALGRPDPFFIVEMGAGRGLLCDDVLSFLSENHAECFGAARYIVHERSSAMRDAQNQHLRDRSFFDKIEWRDSAAADSFTGVFVSNELVDAFPVHMVRMDEGGLRELFVEAAGDVFQFTPGTLSDERLEGYFHRFGVTLGAGHIAEANLAADEWMSGVAATMSRGFVITIDYGYTADRLYGPGRPRGTLMCYSRHAANENPFAGIGAQDITAHVNFSSLIETGAEYGLLTAGLTNQAFFLVNLGLGDFASAPPPPEMTARQAMNRNFGIKKLINPDGLGRYGVLVQYKGFEAPPALLGLKIMP